MTRPAPPRRRDRGGPFGPPSTPEEIQRFLGKGRIRVSKKETNA